MGLFIKYFLLLIFLAFMYTCSLLIFAKGFLLKRVVVDQNSSCVVDFSRYTDDHGKQGCWMHSRFNKAIVVVIDALRFDFMKYDHTLKKDIPYKNKLPIIRNLLNSKPANSKLYKFMADPPTTTFQRLKGLTTGSLPTFVDAGANFASSEIKEDNVIDQMVKQGKVVKFLGDDTWLSLFPGRFQKAYPFPSFNVKDLHTVDDGILKHLFGQLNKKDWSVTIAHFLGVDHCGHRYGPDHPAMAEKLTQMNEVISNITSRMKDDTILFVMGDHGMTITGDHGGDSMDELEAGLFIYSPVQITSPSSASQTDVFETISQTDFVPTLALLMGVPIPFSNLGRIITDLFNHCPWWGTSTSKLKQVFHAVKALRLNAIQVSRYLKAYAQVSSDFPINKYYELDSMLDTAEHNLQALVTAMVKSVTWNLVGVVVYHTVLSSFYFYTTGHQATVPTIRFESAFIGFHGDFQNYALPAILIYLNTFAAQVLLGVLAPLWVFWPMIKGMISSLMTNMEVDRTSKGDFALCEDEELLKKRMFQLYTSLTLLSGIKVLGAVCAAGLHRRHLMVWKIFAPRFVFEAVSCFTVLGVCLVMFLFVMRVNQSLTSWVKVLEPKERRD
ncbi:GPI ethanolamine phosphate transferase 3-like isoform X2 [Ylistrum balloti]|uniref:GPI ethanolamine phosphate transferase 3-like isoform X2 n=1 Tax=Ylistrum balloti TaxID=509963 RepID=UPI002905EA25|nr:GPI ethanolamine phosphate transferase 3-like isoform X2 [Ylistrum balloti]